MSKYYIFFIFLLTLLIPNIILSITEPLSIIGAATNIILPAGFIYCLISLSPKLGRTIWLMFPLIFLAAFQIVLLSLYGRSIIAVDMFLNLVTTNTAEVAELLGNMFPTIAIVVVLYVPILVLGVIYIRRKIRLSQHFLSTNRRIAYLIISIGIVTLGISYASSPTYSVKRDLYPVNVFYNIYLAFDRTAKTADYAESSAEFKYNATTTHTDRQREIYLLIIGETARAANWQILGYDRPTNPRLSLRDDIYAGVQSFSESNTTHKSVPMLLSPVNAINFNSDIYKVKSLVTAFKEAGFKTAFFSNQRYNRSFIDFFAEESDTTVFIKEQSGLKLSLDINGKSDTELLPYLDMILQKDADKQLIVLHTYGSHFNYNDRYESEDAKFTPYDYDKATKSMRDKLINAYDNTIVATDRLIADCIERLDSIEGVSAGILYTSDHGEDIFDNNTGRFLHASPRPTRYQVHVPFIVWLSESYTSLYPEKAHAIRKNIIELISTSRSFCPTALDMAGIKVSGNAKVDTAASLLSPAYTPREPLYLSDHNEAVLLKDIIL